MQHYIHVGFGAPGDQRLPGEADRVGPDVEFWRLGEFLVPAAPAVQNVQA